MKIFKANRPNDSLYWYMLKWAEGYFLFFHSLVAVLALYLVAGVVFNVAYKKQSGRDLIPNVQFWASLPGLIKVCTCADPGWGGGGRGPNPRSKITKI